MTQVVHFLARQRGLTLVLGFAYYLATALFHDQVNDTFLAYRNLVGSPLYRMTMMLATVLGLIGMTWAVIRTSTPGSHRRSAVSWWLFSLALVATAYVFIVVLASEFIHLAQYAVMAVFLYSLSRRFTDTLVWIMLLGALDEWYQFGVLHGTWGVYYDFNDVVLNLLGGALGCVFLYATVGDRLPSAYRSEGRFSAIIDSPAWRTLSLLLLTAVIMLAAGKLRFYPPRLDAWLVLSRSEPVATFWNPVDWGGKPFHVLHPVAGTVILIVLLAIYSRLDGITARLRAGVAGAAGIASMLVAVALSGGAVALVAVPANARAEVSETVRATGYIEPMTYVCPRAESPPDIDGTLDDKVWNTAPWTEAFTDIQGAGAPKPFLRTRAKMLWDSEYFYIAAELEEPQVWATLTEHDAIIFHDDDFEVFLDPDADNHRYAELEINALGTTWDLLLIKPYRDGGPALHDWEMTGLRSAVAVDGTINRADDRDKGWSVELAIPWSCLAAYSATPVPPRPGDQWRVNFSRVDWTVDVAADGTYAKRAGVPEDNWVWSPQGVINMHRPETWGRVQFAESAKDPMIPDPTLGARHAAQVAYYAQRTHWVETGRYADTLEELDLHHLGDLPVPEFRAVGGLRGVSGSPGVTGYEIVSTVDTPDGTVRVIIHPDSRIRVVAQP